MAGILESIGEKLGLRSGGDKMQYLLVAALALVIIIAIVVIITNVMGGDKKDVMRDQHYWDLGLEPPSEIVIKPEDFKKIQRGPDMMGPMGMGGMGMSLMMNPHTGERTLVRMNLCPSCKEWYVPDMYDGVTLDDFDEETGMLIGEDGAPMMMMGGGQKTCPKCGIDIYQYHRDKRKKK